MYFIALLLSISTTGSSNAKAAKAAETQVAFADQ